MVLSNWTHHYLPAQEVIPSDLQNQSCQTQNTKHWKVVGGLDDRDLRERKRREDSPIIYSELRGVRTGCKHPEIRQLIQQNVILSRFHPSFVEI